MKEVQEETGIDVEPVRLIAVLDGLRLGFTRVPLYSLLFYCRAVGGELAPHPLETRDVGWFTRDDAAAAARRFGALGRARLRRHQRRAPRRPLRQRAPADVARRVLLRHHVISVRVAASVDADLVAAVTALLPQLSRSAPPPTHDQLARIVADPDTTLFVAEDDGRIVGTLTLAVFEIPTGRRAWIEDVVTDTAARGKGVASALVDAALAHAASFGARTVDLTSRPDREDANRLYMQARLRAARDERVPPHPRLAATEPAPGLRQSSFGEAGRPRATGASAWEHRGEAALAPRQLRLVGDGLGEHAGDERRDEIDRVLVVRRGSELAVRHRVGERGALELHHLDAGREGLG